MSIKGNIDTKEIDRGFDRMRSGMRQFEGDAKTSFASFNALGTVAKDLAGSFVTIGTIGVGAMVALASSAPAVAPAIAKMSIELQKISFGLGQTLAPAFESVANNLIPAVGTALDALSPKTSKWIEILSKGIEELSFGINILSGQEPGLDLKAPEAVTDESGNITGYKGAEASLLDTASQGLWSFNEAGNNFLTWIQQQIPLISGFTTNRDAGRATMEVLPMVPP